MEKRLMFSYDREGDILDIAVGQPQAAVSEELQEDFFVRRDSKSGEVVGFMILNFQRGFAGRQLKAVPVKGAFALAR